MARQDFIDQLKTLGHQVEDRGNSRIVFPYTIPLGKFLGKEIQLGLVIHDDWVLNPPSGPHLSPHLLPLHPANDLPHPAGGVHPSGDFGDAWQYWSRPYHDWPTSDRTAKAYMAFIRKLLADQ